MKDDVPHLLNRAVSVEGIKSAPQLLDAYWITEISGSGGVA